MSATVTAPVLSELENISKLMNVSVNFEPYSLLSQFRDVALAILVEVLKTLREKGIVVNNVDISGFANLTITFKQGEVPIVKVSIDLPGGVNLWIAENVAKDIDNVIISTLEKYLPVKKVEKSSENQQSQQASSAVS